MARLQGRWRILMRAGVVACLLVIISWSTVWIVRGGQNVAMSPTVKELVCLLPFVMAAFLWTRGLVRVHAGDTILGLCIGFYWSGWFGSAMGIHSCNASAPFWIGWACLTFIISLFIPDRPQWKKSEMRIVSAAFLVLGFFVSILL